MNADQNGSPWTFRCTLFVNVACCTPSSTHVSSPQHHAEHTRCLQTPTWCTHTLHRLYRRRVCNSHTPTKGLPALMSLMMLDPQQTIAPAVHARPGPTLTDCFHFSANDILLSAHPRIIPYRRSWSSRQKQAHSHTSSSKKERKETERRSGCRWKCLCRCFSSALRQARCSCQRMGSAPRAVCTALAACSTCPLRLRTACHQAVRSLPALRAAHSSVKLYRELHHTLEHRQRRQAALLRVQSASAVQPGTLTHLVRRRCTALCTLHSGRCQPAVATLTTSRRGAMPAAARRCCSCSCNAANPAQPVFASVIVDPG